MNSFIANFRFQFIIQSKPGTAALWRKAIKMTYPGVIVGSQRKTSIAQVTTNT